MRSVKPSGLVRPRRKGIIVRSHSDITLHHAMLLRPIDVPDKSNWSRQSHCPTQRGIRLNHQELSYQTLRLTRRCRADCMHFEKPVIKVAHLLSIIEGGRVEGAIRAINDRIREGKLRVGDPIPSEAGIAGISASHAPSCVKPCELLRRLELWRSATDVALAWGRSTTMSSGLSSTTRCIPIRSASSKSTTYAARSRCAPCPSPRYAARTSKPARLSLTPGHA